MFTILVRFHAWSELQGLVEIKSDGVMNRGTYVGRWRGQEVFLKGVRRHELREAVWLQYFNLVGLGVQFKGLALKDGNIYLVLEQLDGFNVKPFFLEKGDQNYMLTQNDIQMMKDQIKMIDALGVTVLDLQFMLTSRGPVLIDVPFVRPAWNFVGPRGVEKMRSQLEIYIEGWSSLGLLEK